MEKYTEGEMQLINSLNKPVNDVDMNLVDSIIDKMLLNEGTFFIEKRKGNNIMATAWLTDTEAEIWKQYRRHHCHDWKRDYGVVYHAVRGCDGNPDLHCAACGNY